jgi:hypothetical protein
MLSDHSTVPFDSILFSGTIVPPSSFCQHHGDLMDDIDEDVPSMEVLFTRIMEIKKTASKLNHQEVIRKQK